MGSTTVLLAFILFYAAATLPTVRSFTCTTTTTPTCTAVVGYIPPNETTLAKIASFFSIPNDPSLRGVNNFPSSTPLTASVPANQTIRIPFTCSCGNGTSGRPKSPPVYTVVPGDFLSQIAEKVFSGLVTYQEIADFNGVVDVDEIEVGQKLKIPLPCSCDEVEGEKVVHYGHVVEAGSSVGEIATRFGTTEAVLLKLNGLKTVGDLKAAVPIDVPLKACTSKVDNKSLDYPLLLSKGTYTVTAGGCVRCSCDSSNNYTLQCEPSSADTLLTDKCPSMECKGAGGTSLLIGKTSKTSSCTTCAYAGYTTQTILTDLANESSCPGKSAFHVYNATATLAPPPALQLPSLPPSDTPIQPPGRDVRKRNIIIIIVTLSVLLVLMLVSYYVYCKRSGRTEKGKRENQEIHLLRLAGRSPRDHYRGGNLLGEECTDSQDFPSIKFDIIFSATNQFSNENKLGQGGFGPVYKGILPDGKAIAVKRLSKTSGQGLQEFRNEITLIARLQHRNLVRLVGCCLEGNELLLIYEYMPNKSLDFFLFDSNKGAELDWTRRFIIIKGIARGTLYLHEDSRLRIIHRDLKASNVLLDQEMNPKISDFGLARIFGVNQDEANTNRVVGTYGYMAPEYAMEGLFSVKSDVFSFGVLLLEIISGKKNSGFYVNEHGHNLLSFAWELWSKGGGLELLDPLTKESSVEDQEVLKCIHIGLSCVQDDPADRPTMSVVVVMLASDTVTLPQPTKPTFPVGRQVLRSSGSSSNAGVVSVNEITISTLSPR